MNGLVFEGIPIQNVDLKTRWARPDSGTGTLKMDRVTLVGERALRKAVRLDAMYLSVAKYHLNCSSDKKAQNRVFSKGYVQKAEDTLQVAMDSLHIKIDEVVLNNEDSIRFAYSPSRGVQIKDLELRIKDLELSKSLVHLKKQDQQTVEVVLEDLRPWASLAGVRGGGGKLDGKIVFGDTLTDTLVFGEFKLDKWQNLGSGIR